MSKMGESVTVIVGGDFGRSPRMMAHAKELLNEGYRVHVVAYGGSSLFTELEKDKRLELHLLSIRLLRGIQGLPRSLFFVYGILRVLLESVQIIKTIILRRGQKCILLQNPPGIPAIAVCLFVSYLTRVPLVIDWHNLGYSILEINQRNKFLVKIAQFYELQLGRLSDLNFTVSEAFSAFLARKGIESAVLYDRPRRCLGMCSYSVRGKIGVLQDEFLGISSTSWTQDEDFSILLDSIDSLDKCQEIGKIHFVITGKGPLREHYRGILEQKNWQKSKVSLVWLETAEYPKLLSEADLGVCLHTSSSGLDLPMKVVDMQAVGLPALCFYYETIFEFVKPGVNGDVFTTSEELAQKIIGIVRDRGVLGKYREALRDLLKENCWEDEWRNVVSERIRNIQRKSILVQILLILLLVYPILKLLFNLV